MRGPATATATARWRARGSPPAPSRPRWSGASWRCTRSARSTSPISTRSGSRATTRRRSSRCGEAFPALRFWVDAGFAGECSCRRFLAAGLGDLVLGSESQGDLRLLELLAGEPRLILSLDFQGERPLGAAGIFDDAGALARAGDRDDPGAGRRRRRARISSGWRRCGRRRRASGSTRRAACAAPATCTSCAGSAVPACWWPARCTTGGWARRARGLRLTAPTRRRWSAPAGVARSENAARI